MIPPKVVGVLDRHGGFTAETTQAYQPKPAGWNHALADHLNPPLPPKDESRIGGTLWVSGEKLKGKKGGTAGVLIEGSINEKTFYQMNNNVTSAKYKVSGYRYPIVLWWDNATGERIA